MTADDLRAWMAAHGYSVRGLAASLGLAPATVQNWRDGTHAPPADLADRLSALLRPYEYLSLSSAEASLVVDALNGHMAAGGARRDLLLAVYDSVGLPDSEGADLARTWGVTDRRGLVARIAALSDAQAGGVLRAAQAYWRQDGEHAERLSAAGLV
ncbi:MAG: helix-turn-helix transcriptional regulator [Chloroflexota bacterium]|nr:helix-turn-helix transcriptional regulator [Chloroflexota bacterium]